MTSAEHAQLWRELHLLETQPPDPRAADRVRRNAAEALEEQRVDLIREGYLMPLPTHHL